jgi:hypothetical protein
MVAAGHPQTWLELARNSAKHRHNESANVVGRPVFLSHDRSASLALTGVRRGSPATDGKGRTAAGSVLSIALGEAQ